MHERTQEFEQKTAQLKEKRDLRRSQINELHREIENLQNQKTCYFEKKEELKQECIMANEELDDAFQLIPAYK